MPWWFDHRRSPPPTFRFAMSVLCEVMFDVKEVRYGCHIWRMNRIRLKPLPIMLSGNRTEKPCQHRLESIWWRKSQHAVPPRNSFPAYSGWTRLRAAKQADNLWAWGHTNDAAPNWTGHSHVVSRVVWILCTQIGLALLYKLPGELGKAKTGGWKMQPTTTTCQKGVYVYISNIFFHTMAHMLCPPKVCVYFVTRLFASAFLVFPLRERCETTTHNDDEHMHGSLVGKGCKHVGTVGCIGTRKHSVEEYPERSTYLSMDIGFKTICESQQFFKQITFLSGIFTWLSIAFRNNFHNIYMFVNFISFAYVWTNETQKRFWIPWVIQTTWDHMYNQIL